MLVVCCQVEEKNKRIQEILVELGSEEAFFRPKWLDVEQPEEVFNVRVILGETAVKSRNSVHCMIHQR